jgi:hypothetical protein
MTSSSASSPARRALEEFVAGRLPADRLVAAVAQRFYGSAGQGERDALRPVVEVAERAAPGVVSLERKDGGAGFDIRPVERPFPSEYEEALRGAAVAALETSWRDAQPVTPPSTNLHQPPPTSTTSPGILSRLLSAVRRLFSA